MNKIITILSILFFTVISNAQTTFQPRQLSSVAKGVLYKTELAYELRMHSNGFAFALNRGKILTYYKTRYYQLELGFLKDPRERRQNRNAAIQGFGTSLDFVFGKQNSVYIVRGGIGTKIYLSEKERKNGISIGYSYEFGPSLALLRPYYLRLIYREETSQGVIPFFNTEKYSEENADRFLNFNDIYGGAGYFENFDEWKITPGAQAKLALHLSLGAYDKFVRAIEVGVMGDFFLRKLPILVETEEVSNKPYFLNFYLSIQLGYRKN